MTHHIDLSKITLLKGSHDVRDEGVCLLEAVAWWADEQHSDHPACVSPVLGAYGRALNDAMPDGIRQQLIPLIPLIAGTAGDGKDQARAWLAADTAVRVFAPLALDTAGLTGEARKLRALAPVTDPDTARAARAAYAAARAARAADAAADAARAADAAADAARAAGAAADAAGAAGAAADAAGAAGAAADAAGAAGAAADAAGAAGAAAEPAWDAAIALFRQMITP